MFAAAEAVPGVPRWPFLIPRGEQAPCVDLEWRSLGGWLSFLTPGGRVFLHWAPALHGPWTGQLPLEAGRGGPRPRASSLGSRSPRRRVGLPCVDVHEDGSGGPGPRAGWKGLAPQPPHQRSPWSRWRDGPWDGDLELLPCWPPCPPALSSEHISSRSSRTVA